MNTIVAKRKPDGTLVRHTPDGGTAVLTDRTDWNRVRAMTEAEVVAAAVQDPDAQPMMTGDGAAGRPTPRVRIIRRALRLTQEQFATRFQIPLGTLRDWEQGKTEPDGSARAYLRAIAGDAVAVQRALERGPGGTTLPR